jgi:hypothetical protein
VGAGSEAARGGRRLGVDLHGLWGRGGRRCSERAGSVARGGRRGQQAQRVGRRGKRRESGGGEKEGVTQQRRGGDKREREGSEKEPGDVVSAAALDWRRVRGARINDVDATGSRIAGDFIGLIFRGGWWRHSPLKLQNYISRQALQFWYKVYLHPRLYEKFMNFFM